MGDIIFETLNGIKMMVKNTLGQSIVSVSVLSGTKMAALAISSVILLTWTFPVSAGFEWKSPVPTPSPVVVSTQPTITPAQNDILWDKNIHKMPTQKVHDVETAPITISDKVIADRFVTDRVVINKKPEITAQPLPVGVISGFGTKLPLKIALQQIIPPIYKVSLSPGVNQEILVSWSGERHWEEVLTNMLSSRNLGFSRQNNVIIVSMLPIIYPSAPTSSSHKTIGNTNANKADMIPADMIYNDRMNKVRIPAAVKSPFNAPTSVVVSEPITNVIRINPLPRTENNIIKTKKQKTVTIRRDKPTVSLISRIFNLNDDEKQNKVAPSLKKTIATAPSVKKPVKKIPKVSISRKANISPAKAIPNNKKVNLAAYYRAEQASENKKVDVIPTDMISNRTIETSLRAVVRAEKPAPLTKKVPSLSIDKFQATSTTLEPKVKITGISPDVRSPSWSASGGQTLRTILSDWSRMAKVELHWDIDYDYRLNENVAYKGSFNNAVEKLLDRYAKVRPQPYGRLIQKHGGDNILIVNSYDLSH